MQHLNKRQWETPDSYFGFNPVGDYMVYSTTRDSTILDESNFDLIMKELKALSKTLETDDDEPFVYDWQASHWACGHVVYLMLRKDSPIALKELAESILKGLADYPVYCEDDYSQRQWDACQKYWEELSDSERQQLVDEDGSEELAIDNLLQSESFY